MVAWAWCSAKLLDEYFFNNYSFNRQDHQAKFADKKITNINIPIKSETKYKFNLKSVFYVSPKAKKVYKAENENITTILLLENKSVIYSNEKKSWTRLAHSSNDSLRLL